MLVPVFFLSFSLLSSHCSPVLFLRLPRFPSPSPPPGPLASRRGDRIISEAFARFLPPSPSVCPFPSRARREGESLIIVTGHGASSFTYSVEPRALSLPPVLSLSAVRVSSRVLSLPLARAVFPSALPTLQYTLSICLLRSEKMKKGGVAREIKGCRRRYLHHPAPTSGDETSARRARGRRKATEKKRASVRMGNREGDLSEERTREANTHHTPYHTAHITPHRTAMVCTPHAKLAASERRELPWSAR